MKYSMHLAIGLGSGFILGSFITSIIIERYMIKQFENLDRRINLNCEAISNINDVVFGFLCKDYYGIDEWENFKKMKEE